ncbi:hypothetical protein, partial [Mitsuokella sp.]|uniref:hypothetical protein n=1 Tax=Mitsuokella sp. TaxID=2049034 RepID=UPI003D7C5251
SRRNFHDDPKSGIHWMPFFRPSCGKRREQLSAKDASRQMTKYVVYYRERKKLWKRILKNG